MAGSGALRQFLNAAIEKAVRRTGPDSGHPERIERILAELPHTADVFSPTAVAEAAMGASPNQIMGLKPSEFKQLAAPLDADMVRPYIDHYKRLVQSREFQPNSDLFTEYANKRWSEKPFEGFSDVPFLQYANRWPDRPGLSGRIMGHEGRHRMLTIGELFGDDLRWPVQVMGEKTDALPRFPFSVYPQVTEDMLYYTSPMDLTRRPRFARGGLACCERCAGR